LRSNRVIQENAVVTNFGHCCQDFELDLVMFEARLIMLYQGDTRDISIEWLIALSRDPLGHSEDQDDNAIFSVPLHLWGKPEGDGL